MTEMLEAYYRMYMDAKPPLGGVYFLAMAAIDRVRYAVWSY